MSIKIIVATHKEWQMPESKIYLPIQVGSLNKKSIGYQRDDEGEHISHLNPYYSELTALYWAWKNLTVDYLGLVHYRRYFAKDKARYTEEASIDSLLIDEKMLQELLVDYDVVVPKKRNYYIETLYSHYANTLDGEHLDKCRDIISTLQPTYLRAYDRVMKQRSGYMFNMFIAKKEIVDAYCEWLFPILDSLFDQIEVENLSAFHQRLFGRVSEILWNVWLAEQKLSIIEQPFVYLDRINWFKKGMSFLKAKFLGISYEESF